jgi:hypothetical protein
VLDFGQLRELSHLPPSLKPRKPQFRHQLFFLRFAHYASSSSLASSRAFEIAMAAWSFFGRRGWAAPSGLSILCGLFPGRCPGFTITNKKGALKGRLVPNIRFIKFDVMLAKELPVFVLKRFRPVMFLLVFDILLDLRRI